MIPAVARPLRSQWVARPYARRRHRTWIRSMVLATIGWGGWWVFAVLRRTVPDLTPPRMAPALFGCVFGIAGLAFALWSLRAQRAWFAFTAIAIFANASLIVFPWIVTE